jgi:Uma2 family endonuclease
MMAADPQRMHMTVEEYLVYDRASAIRYEYYNGDVVAMSGGTLAHSSLALNMAVLLREHLGRLGPCRVYNSDVRVLVTEKEYFYPDVVVSCDIADKAENDILCAPHLVVEVLSPSTQSRDRNYKLQSYQHCPTIREYVLVHTEVQRVEIYRRLQEGTWQRQIYEREQEVVLESLDIHFSLSALCGRLRIPTVETE